MFTKRQTIACKNANMFTNMQTPRYDWIFEKFTKCKHVYNSIKKVQTIDYFHRLLYSIE